MTHTDRSRLSRARRRRRGLLWPLGVCLVTALYALVPVVFDRSFYMRGDTAAQFAPTWYHLGEMVRAGQWPPLLDADSWAGGNYVAEALFGVYNPINIAIWLLMTVVPDLMIGVLLVKVTALVALALGTYLVARDHGAEPWAAAVVATALPISGYTLYWDAGSWAAGLIAFAYAPWVWWTFRRCLYGRSSPWWAFLVGSLAVTQGNPYGTLAVVVTGFALVVEGALQANWRGVRVLVIAGICVAAWLPLVYLPLLQTAGLADRSGGMLFSNNGKMRPELGDLSGISSPTYVPDIRAIVGVMKVPATYFSWFVLPLLPWLSYGALRARARELVGVATLTGLYLLLTIGPSKLWLFRWPVRLVEYTWLGVGVAFAVVLSAGLRRDHWRERTLATSGLVLLAGWLTWAQDPAHRAVAYGGPLLLVLLAAGLLVAHHRQASTRVLAGLLVVGSGLVLVAQAAVFGENASSRLWHLPSDVSALQQRFGDRDGLVLQFSDARDLQTARKDKRLRAFWDDFLPGSMYHVAGVEAVNNYTGMGYRPFTDRLCMAYDGFTKPCGYRRVWQPLAPGQPSLADLMKVQTVVVEPDLAVGVTPAKGYRVTSSAAAITVERTSPLPWPDSHLSWASPGVEVDSAATAGDYSERVQVASAGAGGQLVFGMLAWPGYHATLDGKDLPVRADGAGLVSLDLPEGATGTLELSYRPPGLTAGLAAAVLGTLGALALGLWERRRRRWSSQAG